ncbi:Protein of unknown function [Roseovarius marisflavi]|uniref:DUF3306 domain-containing protein n=1 Tax=Roseovarius marisflavi TaxID=1054996 RepID=A0A1M6W694_9RHOB|nr:DUF3306 domain-containing protein [Roseovarius marisflavi]SHK89005.1 Protein of unknown function [Roseovarius marisflavi]
MSRGDFWSRRKAQVEAEAEAEARASEAEALAARDAELAEKTDAELLEELQLPDPDTMGPGDDFRAFMTKAVPDRLRRPALRRLWTSNPALANLDGLLDYGEDFTDKAKVLEHMQTAYQVGKGMTAHVEEMARQAELEANPPEESPLEEEELLEDEQPEATVAMAEDETEETAATGDAPTATGQIAEAAPQEADEAPPRRRMSFAFQDQTGASV